MTDRENLEFLVYLAMEGKEPLISVGLAKELLGFDCMEDFRTWWEKYNLEETQRRRFQEIKKKIAGLA